MAGLTWADVDLKAQMVFVRQARIQEGEGPRFGATKTKRSARLLEVPDDMTEALRRRQLQLQLHPSVDGLKSGIASTQHPWHQLAVWTLAGQRPDQVLDAPVRRRTQEWSAFGGVRAFRRCLLHGLGSGPWVLVHRVGGFLRRGRR